MNLCVKTSMRAVAVSRLDRSTDQPTDCQKRQFRLRTLLEAKTHFQLVCMIHSSIHPSTRVSVRPVARSPVLPFVSPSVSRSLHSVRRFLIAKEVPSWPSKEFLDVSFFTARLKTAARTFSPKRNNNQKTVCGQLSDSAVLSGGRSLALRCAALYVPSSA